MCPVSPFVLQNLHCVYSQSIYPCYYLIESFVGS
ncbi:hypothetical protein SLEP1_g52396 [Rubroshorea leprosula]|uniref:Uncharacterized protein n=1 Tax=Rubroshorea leprosula TaxID=152421 RepID=A0AAV5M642_9ROSI|nr:hypothetical protein SLEP1_g52396 [Rubroshorea leprosula]